MLVRLGIVGCGAVTTLRHLPALLRVKRIQILGLCDLDQARSKAAVKRLQHARVYSSAQELIQSPEIDAVAVCVPPSAHADLACAVLKRRKHLYLEKPIAGNLDDANRICAAAEDSPAVALIGFNMRSHRLVQQAAEIVREGRLGSVRLIRSVFTSATKFNGEIQSWRLTDDTGGLLHEQAIHHFDLWRFLLQSEVDEIQVWMSSDGIEAVASARMNNGALIQAGFSESATETNELDLFGSNGLLRLSCYEFDGLDVIPKGTLIGSPIRRIRRAASAMSRVPRLLRTVTSGGEYLASYSRRWNHFVDCIEGRASANGTMEDAYRALEVVLASRMSVTRGVPVEIQPAMASLARPAAAL